MGEFLEHVGDAMIDCQNASFSHNLQYLEALKQYGITIEKASVEFVNH